MFDKNVNVNILLKNQAWKVGHSLVTKASMAKQFHSMQMLLSSM